MSNEGDQKKSYASISDGVIRLSPELTRGFPDLAEQVQPVLQAATLLAKELEPVAQAAAQAARAIQEPIRGVLAQLAEVMRPLLSSGWLEALDRGLQQATEAMRNAEAMGRSGWTLPMNATWRDCMLLLKEATTPASAEAAFIEYYQKHEKQSLRLLLGDLHREPKLEDFHGLLEEVAFGLDHGKHRLVVTALIPMLEGAVRRCWADGVWQGRQRAAFFDRKLASLEEDSFDHVVWAAIRAFIDNLYSENWDGDPKPATLNRNWITHGRGPADGSLADCLRMLQAIHTIVALADEERRDQMQLPNESEEAS